MNMLMQAASAGMATSGRFHAATISFVAVLLGGIAVLLLLLFGYYAVVDTRARNRALLRRRILQAVGRVATAAKAEEKEKVKVAMPDADSMFNRRGIAVLTQVFDTLNDDGRRALQAILLKIGGAEYVRRQMDTDNEDYLVELIRLVGDLQLADLAERTSQLIYQYKDNIDIQYYGFRTLALLGDGERIRVICMDEAFVQTLSFRSLQQVLAAYTGNREELYNRLLSSKDHYVVRICIKRIGADGLAAQAPQILPFLASDDMNLVIDTIRSLGQLRYQPAAQKVAAFLGDGRWEVRAITVAALASIDAAGYEDAFIQALQDKEWQVRYNAGAALCHSAAIDDVREKVLATGDKYAMEMLEYMTQSARIWRQAQ